MTEVKDATPREVLAEVNFEEIELSKLIESRRNPRKAFDATAMRGLVESIKRYGVLTPLIVRAVGNDGKFEILAGARRSRASREAGLEKVPCRVIEAENDLALDVIVVENLQRQNVHPLEEADSFAEILELSGGDLHGLCNKVGKDRPYVMKRLALNKLVDSGKKMFLQGKMSEGHAMLISRLTPEDQKDAMEYLENDEPSVTIMREWIESTLMLDLAKAGFSKTDPALDKKAGPCTTCPKRTGCSKDLFDDIKSGDRCTDVECFQGKMRAHITQLENALRGKGYKVYGVYESYQSKPGKGTLASGQWVEIKKKDFCDNAAKMIILDQPRAGHYVDGCANLENCKIHGRTGMHGSNSTMQEQTRKQVLANKIEAEVRLRTFKLIYEKQEKLTVSDKRLLAEHCFSRLWFGAKVRLCRALGIEPKVSKIGGKDYETPFSRVVTEAVKEETLDKLLISLACGGDLDPNYRHAENIDFYANKLKLDVKAIETEVKASFEKKSKKMPKEKPIEAEGKKPKKAKAKSVAKAQTKPMEVDPLEHSEGMGDDLPE